MLRLFSKMGQTKKSERECGEDTKGRLLEGSLTRRLAEDQRSGLWAAPILAKGPCERRCCVHANAVIPRIPRGHCGKHGQIARNL